MSRFFKSVATEDGRPYRLVRVAALAAVVFGAVWLAVVLLNPAPNMENARRQAAYLETLFHLKPRFAGVKVDVLTNGTLSVCAPEELSSAGRLEIERIVTQYAPAGTPPVVYMRTIEPAELKK